MPNTVVKMPQLGESVSEGTIGRWLKQPGERVERDEPLVEIQTDKVNAEVPSPVAGILQQILLPEGATAAVKADMAIIGDEAPAAAASPPPSFSYDSSAGGGVVGHREEEPAPPTENGAKRFYTPVVLRMAEEHNLDLSTVEGTGAHGRVTRKDVERAIARQAAPERAATPPPAAPPDGAASPPAVGASPVGATPTAPPPGAAPGAPPAAEPPPGAARGAPPAAAPPPGAAPDAPPAAAPPPPAAAPPPPGAALVAAPGAAPVAAPGLAPTAAGDHDLALTPMRRAIAEHMARARADIPDAWSLVEIDMTRVSKHRDALQPDWQAREGYELTYLPFFVKAVLAGLRAVPELNASWAADHVTVHHDYNLGIAVSVPSGLIVPVLRGADQLSVAGTARALRELILKARSGKLSMDDLQGATFTVNNPGALGSIMSQPIVPVGQTGIVTMEAIVKRPVATADEAIAVRSMMYSCISFDHRVLDGSGALTFLKTLKQELETVEYPLY